MRQTNLTALAQSIKENIGKVIIGKSNVLDLLLCALFARGHILLEDVPGTGKAVLAKSLARSMDMTFSRVQFTPDLLPSDITGISVFNPKTTEFQYKPGPVFTHVLLADEINRATPRTQSALLECMEERQVTEGGVTRALEEPFLVIATQNPVEIQGTFPLPEAQLDRFLLRLKMGYPSTSEAIAMLTRFLRDDPLLQLAPVAGKQQLIAAQEEIRDIAVSQPVMEYIVALCEATRAHENVLLGVSARGMLALLRASRALAAVRGRDFVTPDDVKVLALPVMAHRVLVRGMVGRTSQAEGIIEDVLSKVPVPTESVQ